MAMLGTLPRQAVLTWTVDTVAPVSRRAGFMLGALSSHPLMGCATFHLAESSNITGLYIGVKEPRRNDRIFERITTLHRADVAWALGVNELWPIPYFNASCHAIQAGARHTVDLHWRESFLRVRLDGHGVIAGAEQSLAAALIFAGFYVWAFGQN